MTKPTKVTQAKLETVPEELWTELRELRALVSKTRGSTPLDSPERKAGEHYFELVKTIHEEYGVSLWSISTHLGLNGRTVKVWMHSHGYGRTSPSQSPYRGVLASRGPAQPASHCLHGHELTEKNLSVYRTKKGTQRVCLACRRDQYYTRKRADT